MQGVRRAVQADAARAQGHRPRGEGGEAARASHRQEATCAAAEERRRIGGATEEEAYNAVAEKDMPSEAVDYLVVEESTLPTDRYFRNAWHLED